MKNNDIANQSVDTSFFTSEKNRMTNQLASLEQRDYFYLDPFSSVNLGTYIIKKNPKQAVIRKDVYFFSNQLQVSSHETLFSR